MYIVAMKLFVSMSRPPWNVSMMVWTDYNDLRNSII